MIIFRPADFISDIGDETFKQTVANLLGLKGDVAIKAISPAENIKELMREIVPDG